MDDAEGTLLDALDRLGIADDTIVIFTTENGGNMDSAVDGTTATYKPPLRGGKATIFEGGVRVPRVIAWPGVTPPGSAGDALPQSEDFYPILFMGLGLLAAAGPLGMLPPLGFPSGMRRLGTAPRVAEARRDRSPCGGG